MKWIIGLCALLSLILAVGCEDDVDAADKQRTTIERYLTSSHMPRLINIKDVENSLELNPAFYERIDYSVYRYIATYYDKGRSNQPEVKEGDEVTIFSSAKGNTLEDMAEVLGTISYEIMTSVSARVKRIYVRE